ncbi:ornithine carbamoyltransferase [Helicobacter monodelphidis]|uniref:ornithine carbamoyltransferase n=1 Tax=Helicobacter sp. 15-1451 TaxID=2004995 RepID=UPI000DCC818F|nr:ornithine carbamoyltransferase [Helicobacter sp. 15-1451]RAX58202.1 ornithine carbamoyltransferase [Helicobacter sp. 15-1451]
MRHFLTLKDFSAKEIKEIVGLAIKIKKDLKNGKRESLLHGKTLAMIFEKNSTRTRVSFEAGIYQLGGIGLFLSNRDLQLGRGEDMKDTARVISRMVDMVVIRTDSHMRLEEFAEFSHVPVINGLSDSYHPTQLLADYLTMIECKKDKNPIVAYIGDGNNIAHSWLMLAAKMGFELRIATPSGYEPNISIYEDALEIAEESGAKIILSNDPKEAIKDATVVTTDTWTSMGQEEQKEQRLMDFKGFCIDTALFSKADPEAIFLHCLPAYRGQEVSDRVLEGERSAVFLEAENRLHIQKGIMVWLDQKRN